MATMEEIFGLQVQFTELLKRVVGGHVSVEVAKRSLQAGIEKIYQVVADLGKTTEAALAEDQFDYVNLDINDTNFPVGGSGSYEGDLFLHHFKRPISDIDATDELAAIGLERVAELPVFLAFLKANPDIQREFPIISGVPWVPSDGYRVVVCADGDASDRNLPLHWTGHDWNDRCRFLVRRKS